MALATCEVPVTEAGKLKDLRKKLLEKYDKDGNPSTTFSTVGP
jgi:hypothetical protein